MPFISAQEYLSYRYDVLNEPALLPLPDEPFTALWKEAAGEDALQFLSDTFKLPVGRFPLLQPDAIKIYFASTSGGRIPVISTGCAVLQLYGLNTKALDVIEAKVAELCKEKASKYIILTNLICNNITKK